MQNNAKRRGLSFLLILAMLFVSFAVIIPVATSADPAEFADFGVQKLASLDLAGDDDTDLRFVFTVGSLDYTEAGFVFSKTNAAPTIDGDACYKKAVTAVHSRIVADGDTLTADSGRFWVAVKMTDVPHEYFDGALYVRPFVTDGEGTRYADAVLTSVCKAAGHVHEVDELLHQMTGGTASLMNVGTKIGVCPGCKLEVTFNDVKTNFEYKKFAGGGASGTWLDRIQMKDVLAGGKHFYPDESNGGLGNDLYAEYSILWNETLLNLSPSAGAGARAEARFATNDTGSSNSRAISYYSLTQNCNNSGTKIAGAFEYPCGQINTSLAGDPYPKMCENNTVGGFGSNYEDFANVGGTDEDHPEWGWHRIGVRYHEDVTNLAAVRDNGADAEYALTVEVYLDGVLVSRLGGTDLSNNKKDYKLYTVASDGNGGLTYTDINGNFWFFNFVLRDFAATEFDAYFITGDYFITAGQSFVQNVTRIDNPAARTETVEGNDFNGAFYYHTIGSHEHVWGAEAVNDASKAADCGHAATKSIHCTICGETKPDSTVDLPIDPSLHAYGDWNRISDATLLAPGIDRRVCVNCSGVDERDVPFVHNVQKFTDSTKGSYSPNYATVGDIRGSEHFYTPGNDLLVEYSVLWTEEITDLRNDKGPYMDTRFTQTSNPDNTNKNIIYWSVCNNCPGSDCAYAGGFEWGGIDKNEPDNPYPKFTDGAEGLGETRDEYPNIGGANGGDGTPQGDDRWGWHRVSIRYREEVSNVAAVEAGGDATYKLSMWVYVDGVLVIHSYATSLYYTDKKDSGLNRDYKLFTAESDGAGGITYTESGDDLYLHGAYLHYKQMASGTAYFEIADYSATIGSTFVQNVRRVNNPTPATLEVESGVFVPATMWYELDD